MKKRKAFLLFTAVAAIMTHSCNKEEQEYCVKCVNALYPQVTNEHCGDKENVDMYVSQLKSNGGDWICTYKK